MFYSFAWNVHKQHDTGNVLFLEFSMLSHGTRLIIYMTMVTHSMLSDYFSVRIVHPEVHILQSISLTTEVVIF